MVSGFVESLQEPRTPYISPKRFSRALGVQVTNLADLTGVHRNTVLAMEASVLSSNVGRFALCCILCPRESHMFPIL